MTPAEKAAATRRATDYGGIAAFHMRRLVVLTETDPADVSLAVQHMDAAYSYAVRAAHYGRQRLAESFWPKEA